MDAARNRMLERNRKAQAPEHLQLKYAENAIRDARGALELSRLRQEKGEEIFDFGTRVSRAIDRFYDRKEGGPSPDRTAAREQAAAAKRLADAHVRVSELLTEINEEMSSRDRSIRKISELREQLEAANEKLERVIEEN